MIELDYSKIPLLKITDEISIIKGIISSAFHFSLHPVFVRDTQ